MSKSMSITAQSIAQSPSQSAAAQATIQRDLSLAVASGCTVEELSDKVGVLLRDHSNALEAVTVLSEIPWLELSLAARRRLGISPDQKKVRLRLVIRDLEHAPTSVQANELRDQVYAMLHEGSVSTWAAREML